MDAIASAYVAASPGDAWRTFDRWSSNLFLLLAVVGLIVVLAMSPGLSSGVYPEVAVLATVVIAGLGFVILYVAAAGLDRGGAWARPTALGLLLILLGVDLVGAAVELSQGRIQVPLGAILAAIVLARRAGPLPAIGGRDRRLAIAMSAAYLGASLGVGVPGWLVSASASPLAAGPDDLDLRLTVACPAAAPSRAAVRASWAWGARDVFPVGTDGLGIAWVVSGEAGDGGVTFDPQSISSPDAMWLGGGSPSADAIQDAMGRDPQLTWGIDVDRAGAADAAVGFDLIASDQSQVAVLSHGSLTVRAVYAHLDRWVVEREATCDW